TAYRPDPVGRVVLGQTAQALGGRAFGEGDLAGAGAALRRAVGTGPTTTVASVSVSRRPLAPYAAGIALALLAAAAGLRRRPFRT
ncbi:MAG: hypothetical protein ABUS54_12755, partial [Actinomycetota bacterium]